MRKKHESWEDYLQKQKEDPEFLKVWQRLDSIPTSVVLEVQEAVLYVTDAINEGIDEKLDAARSRLVELVGKALNNPDYHEAFEICHPELLQQAGIDTFISDFTKGLAEEREQDRLAGTEY